jgi:hypothetical protein
MQVLLKHRVDPNQNTILGENKLQVQPMRPYLPPSRATTTTTCACC